MSDAALEVPDPLFDVAEARRILQEGEVEHTFDKVFASFTLMDNCAHDLQITLGDMLHCLDYGGTIAEVGARCLHVRTGRNEVGGLGAPMNGLPFVVDRADWESWLREHGVAEG